MTEQTTSLDDVREGDRIRIDYAEARGVSTSDTFTVQKVGEGRLYFSTGASDYYSRNDIESCEASITLLDRPARRLAPGTVTRGSSGYLYVRTENGFFDVRRELFVPGGNGPDLDVARGKHEVVYDPSAG